MCEIYDNFCKNGATCKAIDDRITCECQRGFNGPQCQYGEYRYSNLANQSILTHIFFFWYSDINECTISSYICQNGGTCINEIGGFLCQCMKGFDGEVCQISSQNGDSSSATLAVGLALGIVIILLLVVVVVIVQKWFFLVIICEIQTATY